MSTEDYETLKALRAVRTVEGEERRHHAFEDFPSARLRCLAADFLLIQHSDLHYSLRRSFWIIDLYPGNQRAFRSKGAPFLKLPRPWSLLDVATAAAQLQGTDAS